jgi:hypothetical protein
MSSVVVVTPIKNVRSARRTVASTRIARTPRRAVAVMAAQNPARCAQFRHDRPGAPVALPETKDLLGRRIAVQQDPVAVDGHDAGGNVAEHVRRFEPHLAQLARQRRVLCAHDGDAAREIRRHRGHGREQRQLDGRVRVAVVWWPKKTSAKYTMPASRVTRPVLAGHQYGAHRDQRHIQGREVALRPPGDVHDRGDEGDVEQRLAVQEGQTRPATPDMGVPIGGDGRDHRRHQQEGRDEDVRRRRDLELERGAEVDRHRDAHPPHVHGAE